ncbi:hypothetical protein [Staphylococcus phage vB_SsapH-Golestan-100]|nr:hypothetical protein [Staphylococcus phage vB_SsapH-Golestan-100]
MVDNTTELLSLIVKAMSEKGIELNHVDLYEEAVGINNKVKVCIGYDSYITRQENETGGRRHWSDNDMLIKVLELLTENDWLPGDDIEAYGEWFTLVVEESSYYAERNEYQVYRLLDENYSLSKRMTLEDLKNNYTNVSLEQGRLK